MIISLLSRSIIDRDDITWSFDNLSSARFRRIVYLLKNYSLLAFWYFQLKCNRKMKCKISWREIIRVCAQLLTLLSWKKQTRFSPRYINLQIDLAALVYYNVHELQTNRNNESINSPAAAASQLSVHCYQETLVQNMPITTCAYRWSIKS